MNQTKNPHWGTTLDAFLESEGIREIARIEALTRSFNTLVQRRSACDVEFAEQLLREAIGTALTGEVDTNKTTQ